MEGRRRLSRVSLTWRRLPISYQASSQRQQGAGNMSATECGEDVSCRDWLRMVGMEVAA